MFEYGTQSLQRKHKHIDLGLGGYGILHVLCYCVLLTFLFTWHDIFWWLFQIYQGSRQFQCTNGLVYPINFSLIQALPMHASVLLCIA